MVKERKFKEKREKRGEERENDFKSREGYKRR